MIRIRCRLVKRLILMFKLLLEYFILFWWRSVLSIYILHVSLPLSRQHFGRLGVAHRFTRIHSYPSAPTSQSFIFGYPPVFFKIKKCFVRPYAEWLAYVNAQPALPLTISTSYGDDEQTGTWNIVIMLFAVADKLLQFRPVMLVVYATNLLNLVCTYFHIGVPI